MPVVAVPIPKGALFTVSVGAYSDYTVKGVFRALAEIDACRLRDAWVATHPEQAEQYGFDETAFLASISHLMEQLDCWDLYLGDYSNANEVRVWSSTDQR